MLGPTAKPAARLRDHPRMWRGQITSTSNRTGEFTLIWAALGPLMLRDQRFIQIPSPDLNYTRRALSIEG